MLLMNLESLGFVVRFMGYFLSKFRNARSSSFISLRFIFTTYLNLPHLLMAVNSTFVLYGNVYPVRVSVSGFLGLHSPRFRAEYKGSLSYYLIGLSGWELVQLAIRMGAGASGLKESINCLYSWYYRPLLV